MRNRFILAILIAMPAVLSAQSYPRNYFIAPLDTPLIISGTFGEIRDNHLHSGLDLSTNQEEGLPVMAAADGYISRVKITPDGYGKALYITHPNGYVTVYGHLQKFTAALNSYVRKMQYEKHVFELDEKLTPNEFKVSQRDVIAYSGNSGSTFEPHLHFEIRDEISEEPINPLLFGLSFRDTVAPLIKYIRIYPVRENGIVNKSDSAETYETRIDNGVYSLITTEFPIVYGNIAFGIGTDDFQYKLVRGDENDSDDDAPVKMNEDTTQDSPEEILPPSHLGIYSVELYIDDTPTFTWRYDRLNFSNTRDVNGHIDYRIKQRSDKVIERCHKLSGDNLGIYGNNTQTGFSSFTNDASHDIKIVVRDFKGNMSQISFSVISYSTLVHNPYLARPENSLYVATGKGIAIHKSKLDVVIPEGAAYEDFFYSDSEESDENYLSGIFTIGDPMEALRLPMTIGIKADKDVVDSLKSKTILVRIDQYQNIKSFPSEWNGKFLTTKTLEMGSYVIALDTVGPRIEKFYVPADLNTMYGGTIQYKIQDELSGIKSYGGKIDDKWYLFEYDLKSKMIIANVDPIMDNKDHKVELTVTDKSGNTTVWKSSFYF